MNQNDQMLASIKDLKARLAIEDPLGHYDRVCEIEREIAGYVNETPKIEHDSGDVLRSKT